TPCASAARWLHGSSCRCWLGAEGLSSHGARAAPLPEPPADDPLRINPDQRRRQGDRLGPPPDLDRPWTPRVCALQIVDYDRGSPAAGNVAELFRLLQLVAPDVDRVARRVVDPSDRDYV